MNATLQTKNPNKGNNFKNVRRGVRSDAEKRGLSDSLGPLTETFSAPLPAPLVKTLKSATSFTLTPLGWRPLPVALHAFGFMAERNDSKCKREKYLSKQKATDSSQQLTAVLVAKRLKYPIQWDSLKVDWQNLKMRIMLFAAHITHSTECWMGYWHIEVHQGSFWQHFCQSVRNVDCRLKLNAGWCKFRCNKNKHVNSTSKDI